MPVSTAIATRTDIRVFMDTLFDAFSSPPLLWGSSLVYVCSELLRLSRACDKVGMRRGDVEGLGRSAGRCRHQAHKRAGARVPRSLDRREAGRDDDLALLMH